MDDGLHDWGWVGRERALPGATALLILGMHRSGTSAVTRVLNLRGAQVVRQLHGPSASNPRGHWEPAELSSIHDGLFGFLNSDWTDFRSLDLARLKVEVCNQFEQWLIELLGRNFASAGLFAIKDPRMCRFVPLWLDVTRKFGAEPKAVIPVRNPLEVAASLRRRDGLSSAHSHLLWLRHVLDTELHTREIDRVFVTYSVLLSDWKRTTDWIARKLKITWPLSAEDSGADVDAFLDKKLRHHEVSPSELQRHSGTPALVKVAFEALAMAAEKEIGDDAEFQNGFDRIRAELDQIVESCGMQSRKYLGGLSRRDGEVSGPVSAESAQSAQIAVLLKRIDALDEQVAELERARIDAELERARTDAELERARIEAGLEHALLSEACAEAQQRLAHARHRLNDMKKSMSWKLMKPARSAARLLTRRSHRNNLKFPENHAHASSSTVRTVNRLNKRPLVSGQLYPPAPTPELQLPDAFVLRAFASHSEIAVVLHLCEPAVWDEIHSLMKNIPFHFDLFVSLVHGSSGDLKQDIEARYPGAIVLVFPVIILLLCLPKRLLSASNATSKRLATSLGDKFSP